MVYSCYTQRKKSLVHSKRKQHSMDHASTVGRQAGETGMKQLAVRDVWRRGLRQDDATRLPCA